MSPMANGISPWMVALFRGVLEAALLAAVAVVITAVSAVDGGDLAPYAPFAVIVLRQLEGVIDQRVDPTKQRVTGGTAAK
jgi:hypothetical protein